MGDEQVQNDVVVCSSYCGPDRRRGGLVRIERWVIKLVRSKWLAMFGIAFAVSWSFHEVDEVSQHRLERQQRVTICVIEGVASAQNAAPPGVRIRVAPILQACEKRQDK